MSEMSKRGKEGRARAVGAETEGMPGFGIRRACRGVLPVVLAVDVVFSAISLGL